MGKVPNGVFSKNWFLFATHGSSVTERDLRMYILQVIGKSSLFSKLFCAQLSFAQSNNILMERPSLQSSVFKNHKDLSECQDSCPLFEDNVTRLSVHESINIPKAY